MTGCMSLDLTGFLSDRSFVPYGHHERAARLAGDPSRFGALEVGRRADEHRLRELQLQLLGRPPCAVRGARATASTTDRQTSSSCSRSILLTHSATHLVLCSRAVIFSTAACASAFTVVSAASSWPPPALRGRGTAPARPGRVSALPTAMPSPPPSSGRPPPPRAIGWCRADSPHEPWTASSRCVSSFDLSRQLQQVFAGRGGRPRGERPGGRVGHRGRPASRARHAGRATRRRPRSAAAPRTARPRGGSVCRLAGGS